MIESRQLPGHFLRVLSLAFCAGSPGCAGCTNEDPNGPSPETDARWQEVKQEIRERFPRVHHVTTEQVRTLLGGQTPPLVIDVRSPAEFAVSHLRGARNLPSDAASFDLAKDRPVLVYCSVGYRSADVAERLRAAGHHEVSNYLGSIFEWANEGLPVYRGTEPTTKVHPFNADWGRLLHRPSAR